MGERKNIKKMMIKDEFVIELKKEKSIKDAVAVSYTHLYLVKVAKFSFVTLRIA